MTTSSTTGAVANAAIGWAERATRPAVRRRAALCVLDHLACVCEGADSPQASYPRWLTDCQFGGRYATAVGGLKLPAALAAYCNGQAANALDYDDTLVGHPGAAVIAACLAAGESSNASLEQVVAGICAGYDVHYALTVAGRPTPARSALVRGIGVWESVAAAVAVAIVWRLSEAEVRSAIDLAVAHAVPPYVAKWYERPVPSVKNNLGWAALAAIWSVEQVLEGARGVSNALDGPNGFFRIAGSDRWNWPPQIDADMPGVLRVAFKRFPACWHLQEYLRAVQDMVMRTGMPEEGAVHVDCVVTRTVLKFLDYRPSAPADLAFSLPCTAALVLLGEEIGAGWSDPLIYDSPAVQSIVSRSSFRLGRRRLMQLQIGQLRTRQAQVPVADYWSPAPWGLRAAGVMAKYEALASRHVAGAVAAKAAKSLTSSSCTGGLDPVVNVLRSRHVRERGR